MPTQGQCHQTLGPFKPSVGPGASWQSCPVPGQPLPDGEGPGRLLGLCRCLGQGRGSGLRAGPRGSPPPQGASLGCRGVALLVGSCGKEKVLGVLVQEKRAARGAH